MSVKSIVATLLICFGFWPRLKQFVQCHAITNHGCHTPVVISLRGSWYSVSQYEQLCVPTNAFPLRVTKNVGDKNAVNHQCI